MTDSRYALTVDDLVASVRVDRTHQVETQCEPVTDTGGWSPALHPHGAGGDADGD